MAAFSQRQAHSAVFSLISLVIPGPPPTTRCCPAQPAARKNLPTISCGEFLGLHHVYFAVRVGYWVGHVATEPPSYVGYQRYLWGGGSRARIRDLI